MELKQEKSFLLEQPKFWDNNVGFEKPPPLWLRGPWNCHFENSEGKRIKKEIFLYISVSVTFSLQQIQLAIRANEKLFGAITPQEQTFFNWLVSTSNLAKLKYWNPEQGIQVMLAPAYILT